MEVPGNPQERRKHERIKVQFKVTLSFSGGGNVGEGVLTNLSEGGCAVRGQGKFDPGVFLQLKIFVPQESTPIVVDSAAVRWMKGGEFGVEFHHVKVPEMERLRRFLEAQKRARGASPA